MTLATAWVRRGVASQFPTKYEIDEAELGRISKLARLQLEDAQHKLEDAQNGQLEVEDAEESEDQDSDAGVATGEGSGTNTSKVSTGNDNELEEYDLDDYDADPIDDNGEGLFHVWQCRLLSIPCALRRRSVHCPARRRARLRK